ncbi:cardiolipin synthase [Emergencia sp.]|uniref:cardiolipin synthase n=1 Tax=Emergencia sp. TaxID=1926557 RepID=UPI003AEF8A8B
MITALGKAINKIFNRLTITVALILVQLGWFAVLLFKLADYASWISVLFTVLAALMALFVIWRDDNPAYKMGWILLICLMPILGSAMYVFFGNKRPAKSLKWRIDPQDALHRDDLKQEEDLGEIMNTRLLDTVNYIAQKGPYPAWTDTKSKYYAVGDDVYPDILTDLKKAEHFIFMEYFIIADGKMWDGIFRILKEKAAAGVDVRITFDDVGSINKTPKRFLSSLMSNGIKVLPFNPLTPIASLIYNNRDHRKILVVDGYIAYSGGFNIADEYINEVVRFGHWKDTGIRLEGHAVWNFTVMFLNMWNAFRKTEENYDKFRPHVNHPEEFGSDGIIQPYSDSPLDDENMGENVYLEILSQAEDYVYIFTPYLIIDNEMQTALSLAAKRGVDVRIVTPAIPDKKMVFRLTRSYYRPLIKAGVRIYEYTPGFIHAKSYLSDDKIGVVGTINMDYRSLFLHFECGTLMIGCEALYDLKRDCEDTFSQSKEIHHEDCRRGFFGLLFDGVLRVLSPLL